MQLDHYVSTLNRHLQARFGQRVHKLSLSAGFTCPNRDGTLGRKGCSFCNVRSFHRESAESIAEQVRQQKTRMDRATRYLAYFQAYTNTYAEVEELERLYRSALQQAEVVGLCVGTRPDCVPDAVLRLLAGLRDEGYEVWLELGLQSAHDATLERVRRGHGWAAYADAVARAQAHGVPVCTHLILGLPGEGQEAARQTLERVLEAGVQGLKLHPLMVVRGSALALAWRKGELQPPALADYAAWAGELIRRTPTDVIYHRVAANAHRDTLLAPDWCASRWPGIQAVLQDLARHGGQGAYQSCAQPLRNASACTRP